MMSSTTSKTVRTAFVPTANAFSPFPVAMQAEDFRQARSQPCLHAVVSQRVARKIEHRSRELGIAERSQ